MRGQKLLLEAMKKYPIGTVFISPHTKQKYTVKESEYGIKGYYLNDSETAILCHQNVTQGGEYLIFENKWAKIISLPFKYYELW